MENTAKQCRLGLFQDSDFSGDLGDLKSTSGGTLCIFGRHTFVPSSWLCKKQTAISHSSTESEIISLDTGLRLDGLLVLELLDLIVSVLGNVSHVSDRAGQPVNGKNNSYNKIDVVQVIDSVPSNVQSANQEASLYVFEDNEAVIKMMMKGRSPKMRHVSRTHRVALDWLFDRINLDPKIQIKYIDTKNQLAVSDRTGKPESDDHKHHKSHNNIDAMKDIDSVPSNVQSARQEALLYVFEDNEAVIKMIIKGRSPTMRHVSRTHRVAFDSLFDRINLDPKIQIKYIDTKNQLADVLTKGNFTRDECNRLLCLFNISHFSSTVCSDTMAKRSPQDSGEERVTSKSRLLMSLIARVPSNLSSPTSVSPEKRSFGNQNPWSTNPEKEERLGRPVVGSDRKTASDYYYHEQLLSLVQDNGHSLVPVPTRGGVS